jgi:hypothetical protein
MSEVVAPSVSALKARAALNVEINFHQNGVNSGERVWKFTPYLKFCIKKGHK